MQNRQLHRLFYKLRHDWLTTNNVVLTIALVIAASWAFSSVQAVERNYQLQRQLDDKRRQQQLAELETQTLQFEQRYYSSAEYQTLELKRRLGLALPGEKLLVLPPNSAKAKAVDISTATFVARTPIKEPPFKQWMDLLFGDKSRGLQN